MKDQKALKVKDVLRMNEIRAIIYMELDHEDTYSDLEIVENQSAKNCFNAISKNCSDNIAELPLTIPLKETKPVADREELIKDLNTIRACLDEDMPESGYMYLKELIAKLST